MDPDGREPFLFGAATAALQIEGATDAEGRGASQWDVFCREHPERIFGGEGPERGCDHYGRWKEDLDWIRRLGHTAYRFSIAWPRILPAGRGGVNPAGLAFYDRLVDGLLARDLRPSVTLYHWDLPQALADEGGWENESCCEAFVAYVETCVKTLGDRVKMWATLNEPGWSCLNGYLTGLHPPCVSDRRRAVSVATRLLDGHACAIVAARAIRSDLRLGLVCNMSRVRPAGDADADRRAARVADGVLNRWFSDPVLGHGFPRDTVAIYDRHGLLPPDLEAVERRLRRAPLDWLGLNYYYPHHASAVAPETRFHLNTSGRREEACLFSLDGCFAFVRNPRGRHTDWGWEVDADGLEELLVDVHRRAPELPLYVTENGIGLREEAMADPLDDGERIAFLEEHLRAVDRARRKGVPVRGYFMWSLMDNFSWINGYGKRYGFLRVDRETLDRTPRRSAWWFRDFVREHLEEWSRVA